MIKIKPNLFVKLSLASGLTLMLAFAAGCATNSASGDQMKPMKGGEHQMMLLKPVQTKEEADAVKPDETFAMVCARCKSVYTTRVKQGVKGAQLLKEGTAPTELIGTHACAGCGGRWTITGVGKGAKTELKHTCSACGEDSGFCCATAPGSGPTAGMENRQ